MVLRALVRSHGRSAGREHDVGRGADGTEIVVGPIFALVWLIVAIAIMQSGESSRVGSHDPAGSSTSTSTSREWMASVCDYIANNQGGTYLPAGTRRGDCASPGGLVIVLGQYTSSSSLQDDLGRYSNAIRGAFPTRGEPTGGESQVLGVGCC
jgi:hypothetical protein